MKIRIRKREPRISLVAAFQRVVDALIVADEDSIHIRATATHHDLVRCAMFLGDYSAMCSRTEIRAAGGEGK